MSATASGSIIGVQFQVDGVNAGPEDTTTPYSVSVTAPNGAHTLTAVGRDANGNAVTSAPVSITVSGASGTSLTINGTQTFQTMDGVGVNMNSLSWKGGELMPAIDKLVDEMGATLFRVVFDMEDWEDTNDNADPNVADWTYYNALYSNAKFQNLWGTLHYLNQKGVTNGIVLSFMGRVPTWMGGGVTNSASESEWVEMIATLLYYARTTAQVQFAMVDPMNETDWDGIEGPQVSAAQYVRLLHNLSLKLDAMGLGDIHFVGPTTAIVGTGVGTYLPQMLSDSVIMGKVDHFGLHDYSGNTGGANAAIKGSAYPNKNFWMTEYGVPADSFSFLGQNASATLMWEAYDSVYNHALWRGANAPSTCAPSPACSSTAPNDDFLNTSNCCGIPAPLAYNASTGTYSARQQFYQMQTFRYIRPGSIRIGASASGLTVYAFRHPATGQVTIVGRNTGASSIKLSGSLSGVGAVGVLQFYQTSISDNYSSFTRGADAIVTGGSFVVTVPVNSYFTLTTPGN
jgi:hypothetical protein